MRTSKPGALEAKSELYSIDNWRHFLAHSMPCQRSHLDRRSRKHGKDNEAHNADHQECSASRKAGRSSVALNQTLGTLGEPGPTSRSQWAKNEWAGKRCDERQDGQGPDE